MPPTPDIPQHPTPTPATHLCGRRLCFLQLAAAEGWADRATRDLSVSFATFNGQLSRWGAVEVRFSFTLGGGATTTTHIATARNAQSPYLGARGTLGAWHPAVEALCLLLLLVGEVFPLLRRYARLGLRRGFDSVGPLLDVARTVMSCAAACSNRCGLPDKRQVGRRRLPRPRAPDGLRRLHIYAAMLTLLILCSLYLQAAHLRGLVAERAPLSLQLGRAAQPLDHGPP